MGFECLVHVRHQRETQHIYPFWVNECGRILSHFWKKHVLVLFPSGIIILLFNVHNVSQWRGAILVYFQDLYMLNTWGIYTRIIFKSLNGTFVKFIKNWWNINIQIASCDKKLHQHLGYCIYITEFLVFSQLIIIRSAHIFCIDHCLFHHYSALPL